MAYREPEEQLSEVAHRARVRQVLDQATADMAFFFVADALGEPQPVGELWIDRIWNRLRDDLSDNQPGSEVGQLMPAEDRLLAIVMLLEQPAREAASRLVRQLREAGEQA